MANGLDGTYVYQQGGGVNPFQHLPGLGVCDQRVNTGLTLTHQPCCVAVIKVRMFV